MELRLRGWSRDHGPTIVGAVPVNEDIVAQGDTQRTARWDEYRAYISADSIDLTWGKNLRLTGDYRVDVVISRKEIDKLFKIMHNGQISQRELHEIDVELIKVEVPEEAVHKAIKKMRVGEFLRLINDPGAL